MGNCNTCRLSHFCFPPGIAGTDLAIFDKLVDKKSLYRRHDFIYKQAQTFKHIYILRSGSVKLLSISPLGEEIIQGFCYPGELLGLNGIATKQYHEFAIALDTVSMCQLNFKQFEMMAEKIPSFQKQLIKLMSEQLCSLPDHNLYSSAESRFAQFLLNISQKMKNYGSSGLDFTLSMTRSDIANYLGLASETISRIIAKFQSNNVLSCANKSIILKDFTQLKRIASAVS